MGVTWTGFCTCGCRVEGLDRSVVNRTQDWGACLDPYVDP